MAAEKRPGKPAPVYSISQVTPGWLSQVLGAEVLACKVEEIGADQAFTGCKLFRLHLRYDQRDTGRPGSIVIKMAAGSRADRLKLSFANSNETACYEQLGPTLGRRMAQCHFAAHESEGAHSLLVLEDVFPAQAIDFIKGCRPAQAGVVIDGLAAIHSATCTDARLGAVAKDPIGAHVDFAALWSGYRRTLEDLMPELEMPQALCDLAQAIAGDQTGFFGRLQAGDHRSILHRDAHIDNILFDNLKGQPRARFVDWQLSGVGPGGLDLGYFLISSLTPETRRAHETTLVTRYARAVNAHGMGYGLDQIARDLRAAAGWKLFVTVLATQMMNNATAHKRRWRRIDLVRLAAFVQDHRITPDDIRGRTRPNSATS